MRTIIALTVALVAAPVFAQGEVSYKSTEVEPGVYMVEGVGGFGGGNMAVLVGEDMVAMIDNGLPMPDLSEKLFNHVQETTGGRPVDVLINTHVHGDHAGGNAKFTAAGTVVMTHYNIRKRLIEDSSGAGGPEGIPRVTYADGVNFHLGGIDAEIRHLPAAHTDGDSFVHFPMLNLIHTGDIHFHKIFPFIDLDSGGTVDGYIAAMQKIWSTANDETKIIPGHGPLADKASMKADIDMLIDGRAIVKALVDEGKTQEEIVAANPLEKYASYDWQFITLERMTLTFYRDLTQGN